METNRAGVTFQMLLHPDGRPFIALHLTRDDGPGPARDKLFTLDLVPNLSAEEASTLAQALNQCVTHISLQAPGGAE
jgi:hypothetical protein